MATVLFTDMVGSADRAATLGDAQWTELLDDHDQVCARAVERARGGIVKMTGEWDLFAARQPAPAGGGSRRA